MKLKVRTKNDRMGNVFLEKTDWDLSQMDGSGYSSRSTLTGEWLECQPINPASFEDMVPGAGSEKKTSRHSNAYRAMISGKWISNLYWDLPDGAMNEADEEYHKRHPQFDSKELAERLAQFSSPTATTGVVLCGVEPSKTIDNLFHFSAWTKKLTQEEVFEYLRDKVFKNSPVRIVVTRKAGEYPKMAWYTVTLTWVY